MRLVIEIFLRTAFSIGFVTNDHTPAITRNRPSNHFRGTRAIAIDEHGQWSRPTMIRRNFRGPLDFNTAITTTHRKERRARQKMTKRCNGSVRRTSTVGSNIQHDTARITFRANPREGRGHQITEVIGHIVNRNHGRSTITITNPIELQLVGRGNCRGGRLGRRRLHDDFDGRGQTRTQDFDGHWWTMRRIRKNCALLGLLDAHPRKRNVPNREHDVTIVKRCKRAVIDAHTDRGAGHFAPQTQRRMRFEIEIVDGDFFFERGPCAMRVDLRDIGAHGCSDDDTSPRFGRQIREKAVTSSRDERLDGWTVSGASHGEIVAELFGEFAAISRDRTILEGTTTNRLPSFGDRWWLLRFELQALGECGAQLRHPRSERTANGLCSDARGGWHLGFDLVEKLLGIVLEKKSDRCVGSCRPEAMGIEPIGGATGKLFGVDGRRDGGEVVADLSDDRAGGFAGQSGGSTCGERQATALLGATFGAHGFFVRKVDEPQRPVSQAFFRDLNFWFRRTNGKTRRVFLVRAGICIGTTTIGGLAWLAPAVIAAVLSGTAQAWVLLIEIRR